MHRSIPRPSHLITLALLAAPLACTNAVPTVKHARDPVLPQGPQRVAQALSEPSSSDSDATDGVREYCLNGALTEQTYDPATGAFVTRWQCAAGGGIASVVTQGTQDQSGDGAYDQISTSENGNVLVWHFTVDSSDDLATQVYDGVRDDNSEDSHIVYVIDAAGDYDLNETWHMRDGVYTTQGLSSADGLSFDGVQTFDDPDTDVSPDWTDDLVSSPDGSYVQDVHFEGDGFSSDYSYAVAVDGTSVYTFTTDTFGNAVDVDFEGSYAYNADFSGAGSYDQHFEDGSLMRVNDVIHSDGSTLESWSFDDANTDLAVDQQGELLFAVDGSAQGSFTTFVEGGAGQTCEVHVAPNGTQTIDHCS